MFSKQEASQLRQEFWTTFGQYMQPVLSAERSKINWINYKTGEKGIQFRMQADNKTASVSIDLIHPDKGIQQLYYDQFLQLKKLLELALEEQWNWQLHSYDENGKVISKISTTLTPVNIYKKEDWPKLISFFKPRIMALDAFWTDARYTFESLR
jgi:hypothetical protein